MEDRLARLEEGQFFQERLVAELNAALAAQQKQISAMERELAELRVQVAELRLLVESGFGGPVNPPPPHYL